MLYIPWMVILGDHSVKKISFEKVNFRAAQGEKLHVVYQSIPLPPPFLGQKS